MHDDLIVNIPFRIDSQLYHSLSTVVALTYETQKCVSLSELSAMSSSDVLVEMMMMTSGGRSPDHSGGSPSDRFETCCAPFLARLDRDDGRAAGPHDATPAFRLDRDDVVDAVCPEDDATALVAATRASVALLVRDARLAPPSA